VRRSFGGFGRLRYGVLCLIAPLCVQCGKDSTDFDDLKGQIGTLPGNFNVRLAALYRDKIDALQEKVDDLIPGSSAKLLARFAGDDSSTSGDADGPRLSDLFKITLPATESESLNRRLQVALAKLDSGDGPWFEVVDTAKFIQGPTTYVPPAAGKPGHDELMEEQYYLDMIHWPEAVAAIDPLLKDAAPVVVAVLDTGVRADHEDLAGGMWKSLDAAVGYDAGNDAVLAESQSVDENGHGTHVAGIVAGTGGNGKGIHGVAYIPGRGGDAGQRLAEIMNVRVLNGNGAGTSEQIASGVKWAVDQHWAQKANDGSRSKQKLILNMSLGGPFETDGYSYPVGEDGKPVFEDDVLNYATSKNDVLIVVAAGNETCGIGGECELFGDSYTRTYYYPCSYKNVLCVAATTHEDKVAGFSNRRESVGIAAPGYQIASSTPGTASEYGYYSGTSQATPVVAGAAAVVWGLYPAFTADEVKAILRKTAAHVPAVSGEFASGDGRLDLAAALQFAKELTAAKQSPLAADPSGATPASPVTKNGPTGGSGEDPYAKSQNAVANGPGDKGKGSANGCAVVAAGGRAPLAAGWTVLALALGLILPLAIARREAS
jgi:thermitase